MKKGIWVKFPAEEDAFPGAWRAPDGKVVGIYTPEGFDPLTEEPVPARINLVAGEAGHNLVALREGEPYNVTVDPAGLQFERADVPGDCPPGRVRHLLGEKE